MRRILLLLLVALLLCGCTVQMTEPPYITVSLQLPQGCQVVNNGLKIRSGEDAVFELVFEDGFNFSGVLYDGNYTTEMKNGRTILRLEKVLYPTVAKVSATSLYCSITYDPNGGGGNRMTLYYDRSEHLRPNTSIGTDMYIRSGYTLVNWNTEADGSGTSVGLGSRVTVNGTEETLYAQWAAWSGAANFEWEEVDGEIRITSYIGSSTYVVVPGTINGKQVTTIGEYAFRRTNVEKVILPYNIRTLEDGSFAYSKLKELTIFDNIEYLSDMVFENCKQFTTLHINAVEAPYGYDYRQESCFPDKVDLLILAQGQKKLVCYAGCSMWYNLNGELAQQMIGDEYRVINMGLNGVINSSSQMQILDHFLEDGDIFFHTPEVSSDSQMMIRTEMINHDRKLWSGLEYNYDLVSLLDLQTLPEFFDILQYWLSTKQCTSSYTGAYRDSRGNKYVDEYGCASFYRDVGAESLADKVYLDPAKFDAQALATLENSYKGYQEKGVTVYVSYACMNLSAVPEEQQGNVSLIDNMFRDSFSAMEGITVLGSLQDYIYDKSCFYDTNYHLLTEYTLQNTTKWMTDLLAQMEQDGLLH